MGRRAKVLNDLLWGSRPIEMIAKELAEFDWDSDQELVVLERAHVITMLSDYLASRRSSFEIRKWAEVIEGRDDIALSDKCRANLQAAIFQLANPEINRALSPMLAQKIIRELQA